MNRGNWVAENEALLYEHFDSSIIITDKRIRCKQPAKGNLPSYSSIMLKDVTFINMRKDGNTWALVIGLLFCILGISAILEFQSWGLGGLMAGIALVSYYYSSQQHVLEFRQVNGSIKFSIKYMTNEEVMDLIEKIEQIKIME